MANLFATKDWDPILASIRKSVQNDMT